ncbi:MAG: exodeoxyribonuclease VII large subunit [Ruminococcus sp.]|nr:exodeoxyribonuclease VII large subunit [Ruminococcus sp.]
MPAKTVTQLTDEIASAIEGSRQFQSVLVQGELTGVSRYQRDGRLSLYFSLKDSQSLIGAVMFDQSVRRMRFYPEDGMNVIVMGSVAVYKPRGVYQIKVTEMVQAGAGSESAALEQLKTRLEKEGIFSASHKRPIPEMPRRIGVVTSLRGAAINDIKKVLRRRYPLGEIYAVDAVVQGEEAPNSICRGILRAEAAGCDVIIVGRGGGSAEDLSAFNAEKVAYAIYNCRVPVISAVGHEKDVSIADLAADLRAATPSVAAERAAVSVDELFARIEVLEKRAEQGALRALDRCSDRFAAMNARLALQSPEHRLKLMRQKVESLSERSRTAAARYLERLDHRLSGAVGRLDSLSPLKVLSRGYSLVYSGDELVRSSETLNEGDSVTLRFDKGGAEAEIKKKW